METYQSRRRVLKVLREQGMKREIPSSKRSSDANESDVEYKDEIMEVLHVSTASKLVEQSDGDYMINAKTDDGRAIGIRIPASAIETMNKINPNCFRQFSKRSSEETISFFFSGKHRRDNRDEYIFQKFVKPMLT
jgi:hypothetical protein